MKDYKDQMIEEDHDEPCMDWEEDTDKLIEQLELTDKEKEELTYHYPGRKI